MGEIPCRGYASTGYGPRKLLSPRNNGDGIATGR